MDFIGTTAATLPPFNPPQSGADTKWFTLVGSYLKHVAGFTITDEFGNQYEFGGGDRAFMEYSMNFFAQGKDTWRCNAWFLKKITRQTGQVINFVYERGSFIAQMNFSVSNRKYSVNGSGFLDVNCSGSSSILNSLGEYNGKLISPIYLKEINADNFKVKFESSKSTELRYTNDIFSTYINGWNADPANVGSTIDLLTYLYNCLPTFSCIDDGRPLDSLLNQLQWRKLDKIKIQDGSAVTIKEFEFTYNNISSERLMLQKVQEKSGYNNHKIPPYEFLYVTDAALKLPGYGKSHTDHWGYNNGKLISIPADFSSVATYGDTYRTPPVQSKHYLLGSLKQIKFPTGGITKLWLEPHSYSKEVQLARWLGVDPTFTANKIAGGLRLKEIHSYDPNTNAPKVIKKYYYVNGFNPVSPDTTNLLSSGVLGGKSQYWWSDYKPKPVSSNITYSQQVFSTQSVLPSTENSMGSHIGYTNVVEWSSTEGWTTHEFTNYDNGYADLAPAGFLQESITPYQPFTSGAFRRGKLLSKKTYYQNGNPASRTQTTYYNYGTLENDGARSVKTKLTQLCSSGNLVYEATAYYLSAEKFLPEEELTYVYDETDPAKYHWSAKNFSYIDGRLRLSSVTDSKTSPTKVAPIPSQPDLLSYDRRVITTYSYPDQYVSDAVASGMQNRHMIGVPLEVTTYLSTVQGTNLATNPIKYEKISYKLDNGHYVADLVESKVGNGPLTTAMAFLTYDNRGSLTSYRKKDGMTITLDYYTTAGKSDLLKTRIIASGDASAQVISYDHKPAVGISSMTDPNSQQLSYDYDEFNRLQTIRKGSAARQAYCYNYAGQLESCPTFIPTGYGGVTGVSLIADVIPPDLTPTVEIDALSFPEGATRDFIVNVYEINNVQTTAPVTIRITKPSAFLLTYPTVSGTSNVFGGTTNSNGDWTFTENANFITATSKPGMIIPASGLKVVGFNIARRVPTPSGSVQNITAVVLGASGGEVNSTNNISIVAVSTN